MLAQDCAPAMLMPADMYPAELSTATEFFQIGCPAQVVPEHVAPAVLSMPIHMSAWLDG
jgi:hypothetical protein